MTRNQTTNLFAVASLTSCSGTTSGNLQYSWAVYKGYSVQSAITSVSKDGRFFKLNAYTLDSGTAYTVKVTVSASGASSASASVSLQVGESGCIAVISGGSQRTAKVDGDKAVEE
jgi:hypothetical protein